MLLLLAMVAATGTAAKRALLIGVGDYLPSTGWTKINSVNDIELLRGPLARLGFSVATLTDRQATHAGIIAALDRLIRQARRGDHVIIHFSGHGQQMESDSPDEPDGLDEAMVPYDAQRSYSAAYHGQNHLRDKELARYLDRLRSRLGTRGQLLVTLDACHSGDATRGGDVPGDSVGPARGTSEVFGRGRGVGRTATAGRQITATSAGHRAIIYALSACQPHQRSHEYRDPATGKCYGSLAFLLYRAIAGKRTIAFRTLVQAILADRAFTMRRYQDPYLLVD